MGQAVVKKNTLETSFRDHPVGQGTKMVNGFWFTCIQILFLFYKILQNVLVASSLS